MNPRTLPLQPKAWILFALGFFFFALPATTAQAQVQVTAATPPSADQGTINLKVRVKGSGFKIGAKAKWFVTGTSDTGGVIVNSTSFVTSTDLDANITVSDTAAVSKFDIQVTNSDGRGGKGTERFAVTCPEAKPAPTSDTKCYFGLPGCLDSTFGGNGYVHINPGSGTNPVQPNAIAVQPDGKIVVAGTAKAPSTTPHFAVIRYNPDGTLDTSFGDVDLLNPSLRRGYAITAVNTAGDNPYGLVIQPDGKILVVGYALGEGVVVRYKQNGTLDTVFATGGIARLGTSPSKDIALQADGKIVVFGSSGTPSRFALVRLNTNGSLDSSFGSGGRLSVNPSGTSNGTSTGWSVSIQRVPAVTGEERIVVAGYSKVSSSANMDWTLMRLKSSGATDTSFGFNGIVKTPFFDFGAQARRVKIDSSNRVVVAGYVLGASSTCGSIVNDYAVVRYTQDGSLDTSFSGGIQLADIYGGDDTVYGLALQADGKILVFGQARSSDKTVTHLALVRFNVDGNRDFLFGMSGNGVVTTILSGTESWGFGGIAVQPDGKIVAAGAAYLIPPQTQGDIWVVRYLP